MSDLNALCDLLRQEQEWSKRLSMIRKSKAEALAEYSKTMKISDVLKIQESGVCITLNQVNKKLKQEDDQILGQLVELLEQAQCPDPEKIASEILEKIIKNHPTELITRPKVRLIKSKLVE